MYLITPDASASTPPAQGSSPCSPLLREGTPALFALALLLLLLGCLTPAAGAADTIFNSGAVLREELERVGGETKLFLAAPIDSYLPQTAALAGVFALSYLFDEEISSKLAGARGSTLTSLTDAGSLLGNPYLHIGVAAALYGGGAAADAPGLMRVGEKLGEALFIADAATAVLRSAIGRGRPTTGASHSRFRPFQFDTDYDSLPSMHTTSSFAVAHVLASETESLPVKILCYLGAGFVGFSRLHQGKHWASDVVLGAAIGELAGNAVTRYRVLKPGGMVLAPAVNDGVPSLAVLGKF